jgi:curved DNA-binding protein CbpA
MEENLYEILELDRNASMQDIKKQYQKLSLLYHPDKNQKSDKFYDIQHAYSILSDIEKKSDYDKRMYLKAKKIVEELDLDDMNSLDGRFETVCRCGGTVSISEDELEQGVDCVECNRCSLVFRILYDVLE